MTENRKTHLVVIEDNPSDVRLLEFALEDAGFHCDLVVIRDGLAGMNWVREHHSQDGLQLPKLAILDLNLPLHDGLEILEAMQQTQRLASLPVLVLTSSPSPLDVARVTAYPNTRYMTKPTVLDDYVRVTDTIRDILAVQGWQAC